MVEKGGDRHMRSIEPMILNKELNFRRGDVGPGFKLFKCINLYDFHLVNS